MQRQGASVFSWPVRVYYEDTDFLRGARLDDQLEITVELTERKRSSLMLKQRALRGAEPMAEALVQAACVRTPRQPAARRHPRRHRRATGLNR